MQATQTDHALCALSTVLQLRRRLGEPPHAAVASQPLASAVCLGLHTGSVAVKSLSGETPNLAIWLRYRAVPDTIFASGATMRLVHSGSGELSRWRDSLSVAITSEPQVWVIDG